MKYDERFLEILKKLGENVKKYREEKGMTINELAQISGLRKEYIKKIEHGKACGVLLEKHLLKIAKCLNIKLSELLKFEQK